MVGRIIQLQNNYIPLTENNLNPDYLGFRYYDGITVGHNLFKDNVDLMEFWKQDVKDSIHIDGGYSVQKIYIFSDMDYEQDNEFWDNKDYPFLFITSVQFHVRNVMLNEILEGLSEALTEDLQKSQDDAKIAFYLTLDENDVVVITKCKDYRTGKQIASSFHKKDNCLIVKGYSFYAKYSFTISGIKGNLCREAKGVPSKCTISIVEKSPGSIEVIVNEIDKILNPDSNIASEKVSTRKVIKYSVLGKDDNLLEFEPKSWDEIIKMYEENGPFHDYKDIVSISTQFLYNNENNSEESWISFSNAGEKVNNVNDMSEKSIICKVLRNKLKENYKILVDQLSKDDTPKNRKSVSYYKMVWQILNSIQKFQNDTFEDYIYICMYAPLNMLVEKMSSEIQFEKQYEENGIYDILTYISQTSQNLVQTEKQFIHTPQLKAGCFYIPVKLNAFYAAFVYKVKNYLNKRFGLKDNNDQLIHSYEFMIYSGMNEKVKAKKFFESSQDGGRLLFIEIPEKATFDPKQMMIDLSHEIGHFVGSSLRMREKRYEMLIDAVPRMIGLCIYLDPEIRKFLTENGLDLLIKRLIKRLKSYIKMDIQNVSLYSEYLNAEIINSVNSFLQLCLDGKEQLFSSVFVDYIDKKTKDYTSETKEKIIKELGNERKVFNEKMRRYLYDLQTYSDSKDQNKDRFCSIYRITEILFSITKECFSDLISILLLDLKYEDYYVSMFKSISKYNINQVLDTDLMIRIALVTEVMTSNIAGKKGYWDIEKISEESKKQQNSDKKRFYDEIVKYHNFMSENYEPDYSTFKRLEPVVWKTREEVFLVNVFWEKDLLNSLAGYLVDCLKKFSEPDSYENELNEIRNDFQMIENNNFVSDKISYIHNSINEYRNNIMNVYCNML